MNRIISKVENNKLKPITLTSKPPKKALIDYINDRYSIPKSNIKNNIKQRDNIYYIEINGETFNITR